MSFYVWYDRICVSSIRPDDVLIGFNCRLSQRLLAFQVVRYAPVRVSVPCLHQFLASSCRLVGRRIAAAQCKSAAALILKIHHVFVCMMVSAGESIARSSIALKFFSSSSALTENLTVQNSFAQPVDGGIWSRCKVMLRAFNFVGVEQIASLWWVANTLLHQLGFKLLELFEGIAVRLKIALRSVFIVTNIQIIALTIWLVHYNRSHVASGQALRVDHWRSSCGQTGQRLAHLAFTCPKDDFLRLIVLD